MTTKRDIEEAIEFEQSTPLPAWWPSASQQDRDAYAAAKAKRIADLRVMKPDGVTKYAAGSALEDGSS